MPFKSEAQRRFMHAQHPKVAERWEKEYGKVPTRAKSSAVTSAAFKAAVKRRMAGRTKGARPFPSGNKFKVPVRSAPSGRLVKAPGKPGSPGLPGVPTKEVPGRPSPIGQLNGGQANPIQMAAHRRLRSRATARQVATKNAKKA